MKNKKITAMLLSGFLLLGLFSCEASPQLGGETGAETNAPSKETEKAPLLPTSVSIKLLGDTVSCDDPSVYVTDDSVTLTRHGTYIVSGTWNDGQLRVECIDGGEVNLVLDGAHITNADQACIVFLQAKRAILTLAEGSHNTLTDGESYVFDNPADDEPDAALFTKDDLIIGGSGTLTVDGNYKNGITSKDSLTIEGGRIEITAADHGIKGKDYLVINGGEINIEAAGDGIKSTNEISRNMGYIELNGGRVTIYSGDEGVQTVTSLTVNGGVLNVTGTNNGIRCGGDLLINGGEVTVDVEDEPLEAENISVSDTANVTVQGFPYWR